MPERVLTSFTVCDTYHDFVGQAVYLLPMDVIVLDRYFNLTKKSNLSGRLQYDFTLFWKFGSGLLFWATL